MSNFEHSRQEHPEEQDPGIRHISILPLQSAAPRVIPPESLHHSAISAIIPSTSPCDDEIMQQFRHPLL
jgi:hypothetical protein